MTEFAFFTEPLPSVEPLNVVQEAVLRVVLALDGLAADEAGQLVHAAVGVHERDELCETCGHSGLLVLRQLERKQLVVSRGGHWVTAPLAEGSK